MKIDGHMKWKLGFRDYVFSALNRGAICGYIETDTAF